MPPWRPGGPGRPPKNRDIRVPYSPGDLLSPPAAETPKPEAAPADKPAAAPRVSLRAALEASPPVSPDQVYPPPPPPPPAGDGSKVLLGDGWKPLASGFLTDQFVKLVTSRLEASGLEAAETDDDNVEILRSTIAATLHQFAPTVTVPWWIGLPMAMLFVYLDLRVAARRIHSGAAPAEFGASLPTNVPGEAAAEGVAPAPAAGDAPEANPVSAPAPAPAGFSRFGGLRPSTALMGR